MRVCMKYKQKSARNHARIIFLLCAEFENFLAVRLKKIQSHQDANLAALKNFKPHLSWSLQHSTLNRCSYYFFFAEYKLVKEKKCELVHIKEKTSIVPVYVPSPYNVFLYFLEGQVQKDSKLGIVTNVGKSRLAKVIFTNIQVMHKWCISDVLCTNSFRRYIMIARCMRNVLTFY